MIVDDVVDCRLRTANHSNHAGIHFHVQIPRGRQGAGYLPRPSAIFLVDPGLSVGTCLLGCRKGQEQHYHCNDSAKLFQSSTFRFEITGPSIFPDQSL